ncbi:MAG: prolyl-tRNA synthetase [Candidatus Pacebacteria bacterium]|nr:prolyl-tRNA synthetase [Candidatus Paceibacterota bacterium]MCD8563778.1 prolyl-tRNA synthetase [Candidatus Paceibacterota bacterium]
MRQTQLFTKTRKEAPADEVAKNAQLLIRAGFIHKEMAGVYTFLPLGVRVIQKIADIIRSEMNKIGGIETQSTALQSKEVWDKTRWSDDIVDNWFKTELKSGGVLGLAFTHEEPMAHMMKNFIASYKDLPAYPYDIRTVFRNEARAKSGIMRGREFFWKALYSFSQSQEEHDIFYQNITDAYIRIFNAVGIGDKTFLTFASGGTFSKYSHEFQTLSDAGEDIIYVDRSSHQAVNQEVYTDEVLADLGLDREKLEQHKSIEVGNIFSLGYKFSEPLELTYTDQDGRAQLVYMGSYGIGISRLMGTVAEVLHDERGLVWPESIAPYRVHLLSLGSDDAATVLYDMLVQRGIEVLFDDRDVRAGEKFADADLMGLPHRIVVSQKSLDAGGYEYKARTSDTPEIYTQDVLLARLTQ